MGHAHSIRENPGQIAGIAALGVAIGAVTAMFFTPRTGEQVRHSIGRRARHGKATVLDKVHTAKGENTVKIEETKEGTKDKINKE